MRQPAVVAIDVVQLELARNVLRGLLQQLPLALFPPDELAPVLVLLPRPRRCSLALIPQPYRFAVPPLPLTPSVRLCPTVSTATRRASAPAAAAAQLARRAVASLLL